MKTLIIAAAVAVAASTAAAEIETYTIAQAGDWTLKIEDYDGAYKACAASTISSPSGVVLDVMIRQDHSATLHLVAPSRTGTDPSYGDLFIRIDDVVYTLHDTYFADLPDVIGSMARFDFESPMIAEQVIEELSAGSTAGAVSEDRTEEYFTWSLDGSREIFDELYSCVDKIQPLL